MDFFCSFRDNYPVSLCKMRFPANIAPPHQHPLGNFRKKTQIVGRPNSPSYLMLAAWVQASDCKEKDDGDQEVPRVVWGWWHTSPQTVPTGTKTPEAICFSSLLTDNPLTRPGVRTPRGEVRAVSPLPLSSGRLQRGERCVLGLCSPELVFCSSGSQFLLLIYPRSHSLQGHTSPHHTPL